MLLSCCIHRLALKQHFGYQFIQSFLFLIQDFPALSLYFKGWYNHCALEGLSNSEKKISQIPLGLERDVFAGNSVSHWLQPLLVWYTVQEGGKKRGLWVTSLWSIQAFRLENNIQSSSSKAIPREHGVTEALLETEPAAQRVSEEAAPSGDQSTWLFLGPSRTSANRDDKVTTKCHQALLESSAMVTNPYQFIES